MKRQVDGFRVVSSDFPEGYVAGYFAEYNPLIPLSHHAKETKVPATKSIPVRVMRERQVEHT